MEKKTLLYDKVILEIRILLSAAYIRVLTTYKDM